MVHPLANNKPFTRLFAHITPVYKSEIVWLHCQLADVICYTMVAYTPTTTSSYIEHVYLLVNIDDILTMFGKRDYFNFPIINIMTVIYLLNQHIESMFHS